MISGEAGRSTWIRLECADYTYIDLSHYISIIYIYILDIKNFYRMTKEVGMLLPKIEL